MQVIDASKQSNFGYDCEQLINKLLTVKESIEHVAYFKTNFLGLFFWFLKLYSFIMFNILMATLLKSGWESSGACC